MYLNISDNSRPREERMGYFGLVIVQLFLSVFGNGAVCYAIVKEPKLRTLRMIAIFNLSIADIGFTLVSIISTLVILFNDAWTIGDVACKLVGVGTVTFPVASIQQMMIIAGTRYICICGSSSARQFVNRKSYYVATTIIVWVVAISSGVQPVVGWGKIEFDYSMTLCVNAWAETTSYSYFATLGLYAVPTLIITTCYIIIYCVVAKSGRRVGMNRQEVMTMTLMTRKEAMMAKMSAAIFMSLIICWLPLITLTLMKVSGIFVSVRTTFIGLIIAYCNSITNPIVYAYMSKDFKDAFLLMLKCKR